MSLDAPADLDREDDVTLVGRREILRVLLQAGVAAVLGTLALLASFDRHGLVYWPYALLIASHAAAWMLLRAGRLRAAVLVHASVYIGTILAVLYLYDGLRSPAPFALSPIVLFVGVTWNGRAANAAAAACSLAMLGLLGLRASHGTFLRGELTYWVVATAVLFLTSVVLSLALGAIARAQARAFGAERERWALQEQLLRAQRLETVARLAAGVAHDFNNLLNVIVGQAGLLSRHPDRKTADQAQKIEDAAWRAADLTQKLLAVGRNRDQEIHALELNELVRGIEPLLRRSLTETPPGGSDRGAAVRLHIDLESGPLRVRADAAGLEQVLLNLVRNAGEALRDGGEVRIRTARADGDELAGLPGWRGGSSGGVRLEVADTGVGMSPEVQAHLFEPFFTTKPEGQGNGLGLASVYGIVKQCGGTIRVDSAPGQGATFRVYLQDAQLEPPPAFAAPAPPDR